MPFDPSVPFEVVSEPQGHGFDPSKPFEVVEAPPAERSNLSRAAKVAPFNPDEFLDERTFVKTPGGRFQATPQTERERLLEEKQIEPQQLTWERLKGRAAVGGTMEARAGLKSAAAGMVRSAPWWDWFFPAGNPVSEKRKELADSIARSAAEDRVEAEKYGEMVGGGSGGKLVQELGSMAVQSLPAIAAAPAGIAGMAVAAGVQSGAGVQEDAYAAYQNQGLPDDEALRRARVVGGVAGTVTAALTRFIPGGTLRMAAALVSGDLSQVAAQGIIRSAIREGAQEFPEEALDQLSQGIIAKLSYDPKRDWQAIVNDSFKAGAMGSVLGGTMGGGVATVGRVAQVGQRLSRAQKIAGVEPVTTAPVNPAVSVPTETGAVETPVESSRDERVPTEAELPTVQHNGYTYQKRGKTWWVKGDPRTGKDEPIYGVNNAESGLLATLESRLLRPRDVVPPPVEAPVVPAPTATSGTASTGPTTYHPYQIAREAEVAPVEEKVESLIDTTKYPVRRVDPRSLKLSVEVPNFKGNADLATGEVTPIEGESYDYRDTGAVQVWVRLNGDREIISGRHRWNQALRTNAEIPVQEHLESEGFTANHARILDAELNIRDGQGEVSDYANYFRNTKQLYDEATARARGLLRGAKSRTGWHIGHNAADDLYALWSGRGINDAKAVAIASAAPGDVNLQRLGIKSAQEGADAGQIIGRIESAKAYLAANLGKAKQTDFGDILGVDNGWELLEAQFKREGDYVSAQRKELEDIITTRSAVLRRFDVATGSGSIRANAKKAQKELDAARAKLERWSRWNLDPELNAQVGAATGRVDVVDNNAKTTANESANANGIQVLNGQDTGHDPLFAFLLDDGSVVFGARAAAHFDLLGRMSEAQSKKIVDGGFVVNGKFERGGDFSKGIKPGESAQDYYSNTKKPDTGTIDMFGDSAPTKPPEQLAEEKRVADEQATLAQGQAKQLTGAVDTSMDMFENNTGDVPLLSQNQNLPASPSPSVGQRVKLSGGDKFHADITGVIAVIQNGGRVLEIIKDGDTIPTRVTVEDYANIEVLASGTPPTNGDKQGSLGGDAVAVGTEASAVGVDAIRQLIRRPEMDLPVFAVRVIEAMLDTPVMRNLDWSRLELVIRNRIDGGRYAGSASVLDNLIELSKTADADTFPHEVFHFLFEMLPTDDRLTVDALRREAIKAFPREGLSPAAVAVLEKLDRGETLFSDDFSHDLPRELYPLINPSEFLATFAGKEFKNGVFDSRSQSVIGALKDKVSKLVAGVIDALRRVFGIRKPLEQITRELLAGRHTKTMLDSVVAYAKRKQGAFSQDAEAARNAELLAQTNEQREVEATHQLAQAHDIAEMLGKHGAGSVGDASKTLLGWWDYLGIDAAGRRLNNGVGEGYRQLKARITDTYQRNWLARMAHQQWSLLERRLKDIITERDEEAAKLTKPGFLRLLAREAAAQMKADNADVVLRITQSVFHSALTLARKALVQESKSDIEIARIEGEIRALDDAEKSSAAMLQLLNDMVFVLGASAYGTELLTDPTKGTRGAILKEYRQMKATVGQPLHNPNLLNWAAYILHKSKELRETLLAAQLASQSVIRAGMGPYEVRFLADFEKDPVKTIKQSIRSQSKMATNAQKAAFAWRILNRKVTERLDAFAVLDDAAEVAKNVLADPDVSALRSEIKDDAKVIGSLDPANPFTKNSVLLPDGTTVEIEPDKIVGSKTEFARVHAEFEAAIAKLEAWLQNPAHAGDINYRMHERNLGVLQDYFAGIAMQQPNDPLRLFKRSFDIVRNAVQIAGGRVAAQVRVSLARLDHDSRQASWWQQRYTNLLASSAMRAIKSHGIKYGTYFGESVHDANRVWYNKVGNQLAYSYNRPTGALKVGDTLASGEKVTQADIDHLRLMSEAISKGFDILGDRQMTQDTLGGFTTFRRALKGNPLMTVRVFNDDLANFSKNFLEHRAAYFQAVKDGDTVAAAAAEAEVLRTLDTYFARIGTAFTWDRNPEFARATVFDGPGGAFEVLGNKMSNNPRIITNTTDYFAELAALSSLTPDEAKNVILSEWGRIIANWNREHEGTQNETDDLPRGDEAKNAFTRSRNDAIAPYVFYENGFKNTHSVQRFASGIQSRSMDEVMSGLKALEADIVRQEKDLSDGVARTAGMSGATKAAEARVKSRQAIARANGQTFDNFEDLERRKKLVRDARTLMGDKSNDTDVEITVGRYIGALTGMLIGTAATARNVTSGPRYIGQLARRLNASNMRSHPLAMWHAWLNMPVRMIASFAYGVPKAALFDLPVGAGKAIAGLTEPERRNAEAFIHTLFRGVIQELGANVYQRVSEVKRMIDAGVHYVPDAVAEWDNKLMGTWLTGGLILENDLPKMTKLLQTPVALVETLVLSFQKTLMPMFGDTGLNMATSMLLKSKFGPFQQIEHTLRRIYADYKAKGYRTFDFANPRSEANVISLQEMFPRGIREMRASSSERDMQNMREQFEMAGISFDEAAARFLSELDKGNIKAQFLTEAERDSMTNAAIDYTNRSSLTNNPLSLKKKNFVNNLIKPFMFWKVRTLSNFLNDLSTSARTDSKVRDKGQLFRQRAMQVAVVATMVLLPLLFWGAATNAGDEEANRRLKLALFNQITGFRQPWEREGAGSQGRGWLVHAFNGVPFLDMAMNTMFNDMPNRASFDPSLAAVEKAKDVARYIGGVAQTGDVTYKLPQLIGGLFPDTKIVMSRMESQKGLREINNVAALATRHGPVELLRPPRAGSSGGVMANELTPYADRMVNAAAAGDMDEFRTVYEEAVQVARGMGRTDPEKAVAQMFRSRNPYSRALTAEMTPHQREAFLGSLSPEERARVQKVEANLTQAAASIGQTVSFVSGDEPRLAVSQGSGTSAVTGRVSRPSRLARGGRVRARVPRAGRVRLARASGRSRRRGFARLSRAPRLA